MDVVEKSFSSRLMKGRARSQAAPSGVSWPLGRPSAATFSFGLVVCLPVPTKKSILIEIVAFTESRPVAFPDHADLSLAKTLGVLELHSFNNVTVLCTSC